MSSDTQIPSVPRALEGHRSAFFEALKIRHYSPATIKSHQSSLGVFFGYLAEHGIEDVRDVSRKVVQDYQLALLGEEYTPMTVSARMQTLRRFFEYLEDSDVILLNPCTDIPLPRQGNRLPKTVLTHEEAKVLLEAPSRQSAVGIRDRAILEVFYSTGIRLEEMTQLTVHDVDCQEGFLRVNKGKFAKDRVVPLGQKACLCVREYLQRVRSEWSKANQEERALWLSTKTPHAPLKSAAIEVMVKQYGRAAGLEKTVTPHVWRHTCASHLVADGANIAYVQKILGHRSLTTTQIYTRTTITEVKQTHAKAHPHHQDQDGTGHRFQPIISKEGKPLLYRKGLA